MIILLVMEGVGISNSESYCKSGILHDSDCHCSHQLKKGKCKYELFRQIPCKGSLIGQFTVFLMFILGDQLEKGPPKKSPKNVPTPI